MRITIIGTAGLAWWIGTKPNPDVDDPKGSTIVQGRFEDDHVETTITLARRHRRVLVRVRGVHLAHFEEWLEGATASYLIYPDNGTHVSEKGTDRTFGVPV